VKRLFTQDRFIFVPCAFPIFAKKDLFTGKNQKTQHCNLLLLLFISKYFYFKISEYLRQEAILCTEEAILVAFLAFE
jgi:hypothetical protein